MKEKYRHPQFNTKGLVAYYKLWAGTVDGTNIFDYSQGGFVGVPSGVITAYPGFSFDGTNDQIDFASGPSSVSTIVMWVKSNGDTSEELIDLNQTDYLEISTGDVVAAGFAGGTSIIYIDAIVTSTIDTNWRMITITDTVGKDASAGNMTIGVTVSGSNFLDGTIGEVMIFDRVLTPAEIKSAYELTKWRYPNN
jgi:hypothetical protein